MRQVSRSRYKFRGQRARRLRAIMRGLIIERRGHHKSNRSYCHDRPHSRDTVVTFGRRVEDVVGRAGRSQTAANNASESSACATGSDSRASTAPGKRIRIIRCVQDKLVTLWNRVVMGVLTVETRRKSDILIKEIDAIIGDLAKDNEHTKR